MDLFQKSVAKDVYLSPQICGENKKGNQSTFVRVSDKTIKKMEAVNGPNLIIQYENE